MAALTQDVNRTFVPVADPGYDDVPAAASARPYAGSAVGMSSGYGRPLVAGDVFAGFSIAEVDNSSGSAGAKNIRVRTKGKLVANVTGVTGVTDKDATVYMSSDNDFTLSSTGNSAIGKISRYESGTKCEIAYEAAPNRSL